MIKNFQGQYRFLSNFYPCQVHYADQYGDGIFPSSEHAYQAAKSQNPFIMDERGNGIRERDFIALMKRPGETKRYGTDKVELRSDWESIKLDVMYQVVLDKFTRSTRLRDLLMLTGDQELQEGNAWGDTYWGICGGMGHNHLGKILMRVREELRRS